MYSCIAQTANEHEMLTNLDDAMDTGFSFAYQPIIALQSMRVVGQEALVRGLSGESAASVIAAIRADNQYWFDQACRLRAIATAARIGIGEDLHLNCSQITPDNLQRTLQSTRSAAIEAGIHPHRIVLEFGNLELLGDPRALDRVRQEAHAVGFRVLADNVGATEVGLKRLAVFKPDFAKLDRSLIQGIHRSPRRQAIVLGTMAAAAALKIDVIAGGVESSEEHGWLQSAGIDLVQGYLFAQPAFERAPGLDNFAFSA
ncbi:MAG: hypothetical protein CVV18_02465 [Gammaproteobacteria bacterium HGW-Gammaproteobacteria-8]|nr:MAG: hypothetical protein CVV18_02465 [Gammaproteobacteria bacterium HGW-Gammaproteobacteria-8]